MTVKEVCASVKAHASAIAHTTEQDKNRILQICANALTSRADDILHANEKDVLTAKKEGKGEGFIDRLTLTRARIEGIAEGLRQLLALPCPVGEITEQRTLPNGLELQRVRVPMGVVGIIYEARPNVTADAIGLCIKSGNAVVLRGSRDALQSNLAIVSVMKDALASDGYDADFIGLITDATREGATEFMRQKDTVDVLIPRGSAGLIRAAVENSLIPVIETGTGNCHVYVEKSADFQKAIDILVNAKTQRISVCNACESLLVDAQIANEFLPLVAEVLAEKGVTVHACARSFPFMQKANPIPATEEDFHKEYLAMEISVKVVDGYQNAVDFINSHSTHHSEAIIAEDLCAAEYFLQHVDSAAVYHNASTRFTDGFEFGLGAEMGISTQKLHARGPMGLKELTSYKYVVRGNGQVRK